MARGSKSPARRIGPELAHRSPRPFADKIIDRATEVIGDQDEALRWIGTPVPALDYATPISLLSTPDGPDRVLAVLDQLEHGVL